jgi:serine phosphatase RsbU (regulator of sigma subunit)/pSer/pThr/pTyr-binding forkhead associated (FHA) protein
MALLTYKNQRHDPITIELKKDRISIGRSAENDIVLNHRSISRHHAELVADQPGSYQVLDLGSKNGVLINGTRIAERATLADGDRVILGERELVFSSAGGNRPVAAPGENGVSSGPADSLADPLGRALLGTMMVPVEEILTTLGSPGSPALPQSVVRPADETGGAVTQSKRLARLSRVISKTALALISNRPLPDIFELVLDLVFDSLPVQRGCLMLLADQDETTDECCVFQEVLSRRRGDHGPDAQFSPSQTILRQVVEQRVSLLTRDAMVDERFDAAQSVMTQGIRSAMCVPLWNRTEVIGTVYVDSLSSMNSFGREELELLTFIANLAAVKIENSRLLEQSLENQRLEEELALAASIQGRLLPGKDPELPGYEICGFNRQCHEVGGDYFDFIERPAGTLGVSVGDVSGKGIGASLLMANLQACLHVLSAAGQDLSGIMGRLNEHFCRHSAQNKFVTFFNAELDAPRHRFRYCNAGHNPPLLLHAASGEVEQLSEGGPVLGVIPGVDYQAAVRDLAPGDLVLLYTDGITETANRDGEEFGMRRLADFLRSAQQSGPATLVQSLVEELARFRGPEASPGDDTTLVLIRRTGN